MCMHLISAPINGSDPKFSSNSQKSNLSLHGDQICELSFLVVKSNCLLLGLICQHLSKIRYHAISDITVNFKWQILTLSPMGKKESLTDAATTKGNSKQSIGEISGQNRSDFILSCKFSDKIKQKSNISLDIQIYFHPGLLCGSENIRGGVYPEFLNPVSSVVNYNSNHGVMKMIPTIISNKI